MKHPTSNAERPTSNGASGTSGGLRFAPLGTGCWALCVGCFALSALAHAEDVSPLLESIRSRNSLPALTAAAVKDGKIVAIGVAGLRRLGGGEVATLMDKWHLGSCTKSMTASVAAILVERDVLRWETTIGASLETQAPTMAVAWKPVTLEQLLGHRGGAPGNAPRKLWQQAWEQRGSADDQRIAFVQGLLAADPDPTPGTKFLYSNQGYTIAASMLSKASGKSWEPLMKSELFEPLALHSAGFGAAGTPGKADQPWGHVGEGPTAKPVPPGPGADNPPAIWPGGGVHMSISDFAKYAAWHAEGTRLLKPETFKRIHTPLEGQDYGYGWNATTRPWGGKVITHNGTNTMNFAVMWIAPEKNFAVVAASNMGGKSGAKACDEACAMLIDRTLKGNQ